MKDNFSEEMSPEEAVPAKRPPRKSIRNIPLPKKDRAIMDEAVNMDIRPAHHDTASNSNEARLDEPQIDLTDPATEAEVGEIKHLDIHKTEPKPVREEKSEKTEKRPRSRSRVTGHIHDHEENTGGIERNNNSEEISEASEVPREKAFTSTENWDDESATTDTIVHTRSSRNLRQGMTGGLGRMNRRNRRDSESESDESEGENSRFGKKRKGRGKLVGTVVVILLIAFGLMHTVFAHATITIQSGAGNFTLQEKVLPDEIEYTVFTENTEQKATVSGVQNVSVDKKATGTVILYNNFNSESYDLIKTTRLQTANGSVYRLLEDVKIPGRTTVGGKTTPGSVNAKVEAELAGSEYNAKGGLELRLPGLIAGTQKYKDIYAKTAANFTGGSKGTAADTSSSAVTNAVNEAKEKASAEFIAKMKEKNPGYLILADSITSTSNLGTVQAGATTVTIKLTTKGIGLKKDSLEMAVEKELMTSQNMQLDLTNESLDKLTFKVAETPNLSLLNGTFKVSVSGSSDASMTSEPQALKEMFAGKRIGAAQALAKEKFGDTDVEIAAWPFWKGYLPEDINKIDVEYKP